MVLSIKHLHIACVVLSGLGFLVRGIWMLYASTMLTRRWVRVASRRMGWTPCYSPAPRRRLE